MKIIKLLVLMLFAIFVNAFDDCPANTMTYFSSYSLGRQTDLNRTFQVLKTIVNVPTTSYTPRIGKTYVIQNITLSFYVISSKETAKFISEDNLRIQGSVLRLNYNFIWQKKQLGSSVRGTAEGLVLSDALNFTKMIYLDQDQKPDQILTQYNNVTFTNNFPVSKVSPYNQADSQILFQMMNSLKDHVTIKQTIIKAINQHYSTELNNTIEADKSEISINSTITYNYYDYRGQFKVVYNNPAKRLGISQAGLIIQNSQTIPDYPYFDCGDGVPSQPKSTQMYGGIQSFFSNSLLKSTVKYALSKKKFNVLLTQQNLQSRAFQFYVGDLYLAIPKLKKYSAQTQVFGVCEAQDDNNFDFLKKKGSNYYYQYLVTMNFSCNLNTFQQQILTFTIITTSTINATLQQKSLGFHIHEISGKADFKQVGDFKIQNLDYANFLISETLKSTKGSPVFGNGYPTPARQFPRLQISDDLLFLYDSSTIPHLEQQ